MLSNLFLLWRVKRGRIIQVARTCRKSCKFEGCFQQRYRCVSGRISSSFLLKKKSTALLYWILNLNFDLVNTYIKVGLHYKIDHVMQNHVRVNLNLAWLSISCLRQRKLGSIFVEIIVTLFWLWHILDT